MTSASEHDREAARLEALASLAVLDTPATPAFEQLVDLACDLFETPMALVSLVDRERQWFKARRGIEVCETPRDISFCAHAVADGKPLVVADASRDPRFRDNPLVTGAPDIRFYAGYPLRPLGEHVVGTLCLLDTAPRDFSPRELRLLGKLAAQAEVLLRKQRLLHDQASQRHELEQARSRLEEAHGRLHKERQLLRAILDASPDPIYARSRSGRYLAANQACREMLMSSGVDAPEEDRFPSALPEALRTSVEEAEERVLATGQPRQVPMLRHRGRYLDLQLAPLVDSTGETVARGVVGVARDTTEIVRQSSLIRVLHQGITDYQALMSGRRLWDFLMEALRELTDSDYALIGEVIEQEGKPALKLHAITDLSWDAASRRLMERLRSGDMTLSRPDSLLGRVFAYGEVVMTDDLGSHPHRAGFPPGHPPLHNYLGVPIHDGERLIGMYAIANGVRPYDRSLLEWLEPFTATCALLINLYRKMSEREHDIEALAEARDAADRANRAKSEFLSAMSHELRTPLNAILGFAQLLASGRRHPLGERQARQVAQIEKSGQHLLQLINQILDLARVEAGHLALSLEAISVAEVVQDALSTLAATAEAAGVTLEDGVADLVLPAVRADYTRLKQVLLNLLSNAIKYNVPGGWARIEARVEGDALYLSVVDGGHGIAMEEQPLLFQPFQRLGGDQEAIEGTGIGLAITRQLLEAMGASIEAESEFGVGSRFTCRMVLAPASPTGLTQRAEALPQAAREALAARVAYVEDNPANQRLMQDIFDGLPGCELRLFPSAEIALPAIAAEPPDAVVMDLHLPGMSGSEALSRLRAIPSLTRLPVIALSANAMPSDIRRGLAAGFDEYLTKPLDLEAFMTTLHRFIPLEGRP
ncbi:PAS fold-containing protein [Halomonas shengliensis]|uniref:histidine kinase n=1 Tax=Halomonas shengliensis TaxID=419597 RepID=A0A1H0F3F7_9GAMM|nr:GAF domain-containing protein [Halomonas shengliensis]SDN89135.1 PAS fold-containing protein [Halomonas shengliensis]